MSHTSYYLHLKKRNNELKSALLPKRRSPTGNYKDSTYDRVSGYKLLFHAELEYYFEEVVKSIMKNAKDDWDNKNNATQTLVALVAYCKKDFFAVPERTNDQHKSEDLSFRVKKAYTEHHKFISAQNHGVKEKNILALFLPIGVTIDEIDNDLLIALDNFGTDRGAIAHGTKAKQNCSPDDAEATVDNILSLLDPFDEELVRKYQISSIPDASN